MVIVVVSDQNTESDLENFEENSSRRFVEKFQSFFIGKTWLNSGLK